MVYIWYEILLKCIFKQTIKGDKKVKDTHRESTLKLNSSAYEKYEYGHLGCWYIKLIFLGGSKTGTNLPKK